VLSGLVWFFRLFLLFFLFFPEGSDTAAAQGHFVHVYVDRLTQRPVALSPALRAVVDELRAAP